MRKIKKSIIVATALFFSMTMIQTNVDAASKKLKINTVYNTTTKVKGKTKKRYKVKLKVGKKTYTAKANKKGNFQIRIPKQNPGKKLEIKVYRKSKYYTKKKICVIAKKPVIKRFSMNSKTITGYTRKKYGVVVRMNKKTYKVTANKNSGKFTVKMKEKAGKNTVNIRIYKNKKLVKSLNKKAYDIKNDQQNSKPVQMPPDKESQIDLEQLNKDLETAARQKEDVSRYVKNDGFYINDYQWFVAYQNDKYPKKGEEWLSIGNLSYFLDTDANGDQASIKALNGITIYGNVGVEKMSNVKEPTKDDYAFKLESGETKVYYAKDYDYKEIPDYNLYYKVRGYKDGKLIIMQNSKLYLLGLKGWY